MKLIYVIPLFLGLIGCGADSKSADREDRSRVMADGNDDRDATEYFDLFGDVNYPIYETTVNATSFDQWVYFDLDTRSEVRPEFPEDSDEWDIAFRRSDIAVNGGISGTGDVVIVSLEDEFVQFDDTTRAPNSSGWVADTDYDVDGWPEYAFDEWYDYDSEAHYFSPADLFYVVQTVEGDYFRLQFLDYYDFMDTSGIITFEFGPIEAI